MRQHEFSHRERYLYFQYLSNYPAYPTGHALAQCVTKSTKTANNTQLTELHMVEEQIQVATDGVLLYNAPNLQSVSHGDDKTANKSGAEAILKLNNVRVTDIGRNVKEFNSPNLTLRREGHPIVDEILNASGLDDDMKQVLINYVRSYCRKDKSKKTDDDLRKFGDAMFTDCGFAQGQSYSEKKRSITTGQMVTMPYPKVSNEPLLGNLPDNLKKCLGTLFEKCQEQYLSTYPGQMNNSQRRNYVRQRFCNKYFPGRKFDWEYINFSIRGVHDTLNKQ